MVLTLFLCLFSGLPHPCPHVSTFFSSSTKPAALYSFIFSSYSCLFPFSPGIRMLFSFSSQWLAVTSSYLYFLLPQNLQPLIVLVFLSPFCPSSPLKLLVPTLFAFSIQWFVLYYHFSHALISFFPSTEPEALDSFIFPSYSCFYFISSPNVYVSSFFPSQWPLVSLSCLIFLLFLRKTFSLLQFDFSILLLLFFHYLPECESFFTFFLFIFSVVSRNIFMP